MKLLVTGAGGFAGPHLIRELTAHGHTCIATDLDVAAPIEGALGQTAMDLRDGAALDTLVKDGAFDGCIHMAGITFVPDGASDPDLMLSVNVRGTVTLLDAFRRHAPHARLLTVSTAHVYGTSAHAVPLTEDAPLRPLSMYAVTKAAADIATLSYAEHHGLPAMVVRPNNHTGPGQRPVFVAGAFARQVREIAAGRIPPRIRVGNLESKRDFMDVRDVVRAYRLVIEKGRHGQAYNIGTNTLKPIGAMLDTLCRRAGVAPERIVDPERFRPTDCSPQLDTTRLQHDTGWVPRIPFENTLRDMLNAPGENVPA